MNNQLADRGTYRVDVDCPACNVKNAHRVAARIRVSRETPPDEREIDITIFAIHSTCHCPDLPDVLNRVIATASASFISAASPSDVWEIDKIGITFPSESPHDPSAA